MSLSETMLRAFNVVKPPEIEFLYINLTKDSSLLLHAIFTVSSTGVFYRKPYSTLVLKHHTVRSAKQKNSSLHFVEQKNEGIENQTKTRV